MGNKGYELEILPSYNNLTEMFASHNEDIIDELKPLKVKNIEGNRNIPLGQRFKVLERDSGKCKLCGRSPADGVTLHVDHIVPHSLGGAHCFR